MSQKLPYPWWDILSKDQQTLVLRRLELEQKEWELRKQMRRPNQCEHVAIKGRLFYGPGPEKVVWTHEGHDDKWNSGCFGSHCVICDADLGWWCPKNPKGYCEYDCEVNTYGCKFCGMPDERK